MSTNKRDRIVVFSGIIGAWVLSLTFYVVAWNVFTTTMLATHWTPAEASVFSSLVASLSLLIGIGWAAKTRHSQSNIDGSSPTEGSQLDLTLRYIRNTQEQLLLFCIACAGGSVFLNDIATVLLPIAAVWFLIARALFIAGYIFHPLARAVGFAGTFHPTIAILLFALWKSLH